MSDVLLIIKSLWWLWVIFIAIFLYRITLIYISKWFRKWRTKKWLEKHKTLEEWKKLSSGRKFEETVAAIFEKLGYKTKIKRNGGVDVVAWKDGKQYLVQCKKMEKVIPDNIRAFWGSIQNQVSKGKVEKGFFITTGRFTEGIKEWVKDKPIELIDGLELENLYKSKSHI